MHVSTNTWIKLWMKTDSQLCIDALMHLLCVPFSLLPNIIVDAHILTASPRSCGFTSQRCPTRHSFPHYPAFLCSLPKPLLSLWLDNPKFRLSRKPKESFSTMFKLSVNWGQTVVVVVLRRIVLWGFREGVWGGTQGGGVCVVGGKLWLTESPPFSNIRGWGRVWEGGGGEEEQQCTGLSRKSLSSACKWSSASSTSYWRSQSGQ